MPDPLCRARHGRNLDPACRCNEYAKVRADERHRLRSRAEQAYLELTPARQGRMSAEQKAKVAAAHDFLIAITMELQ
jgi:hypothetical protein